MIFSYNSSSKGFLTKTIKANVEEFTSTFFFFFFFKKEVLISLPFSIVFLFVIHGFVL